MAAQPKPQPISPAEITITNGVITEKETKIKNHGAIQFHVDGFANKKFCRLLIYAVQYTDDGLAATAAADTMPAPTPVPLGTIKIGS